MALQPESSAIAEAKQRSQIPVIGWVTKIYYLLTPPCFERHVKPLVPAAFAVFCPLQFQGGLTSGRRPVVKTIAESLSHD
jgi:hypothetical protein